jgi:AraC family transcriptional regulator of adaptative response/methylated-DNA-[protein]-cysteine methyltransferase
MRKDVGEVAQGAYWASVRDRDAGARARLVYAVTTTGIYCRPGCPSPRPLRRNVRIFPDPAGARAAGFRACKRCHPDSAEMEKSPGTGARAVRQGGSAP